MLVWEVATYGEPPHEGIQVSELIGLANDGSLKLNRYTLQKVLSTVCSNLMYYDYRPAECPDILADIISRCTTIQSEDRPTFTEILECYKREQDAATATATATTNTMEQSVES